MSKQILSQTHEGTCDKMHKLLQKILRFQALHTKSATKSSRKEK